MQVFCFCIGINVDFSVCCTMSRICLYHFIKHWKILKHINSFKCMKINRNSPLCLLLTLRYMYEDNAIVVLWSQICIVWIPLTSFGDFIAVRLAIVLLLSCPPWRAANQHRLQALADSSVGCVRLSRYRLVSLWVQVYRLRCDVSATECIKLSI
jgi:hypothetical protein